MDGPEKRSSPCCGSLAASGLVSNRSEAHHEPPGHLDQTPDEAATYRVISEAKSWDPKDTVLLELRVRLGAVDLAISACK